MCCRERPKNPELPLREPPGCLPRVVPGEIKVLPSDGREMAKRLVVDLNAMFPQGGHQYAPPDEQLPAVTWRRLIPRPTLSVLFLTFGVVAPT